MTCTPQGRRFTAVIVQLPQCTYQHVNSEDGEPRTFSTTLVCSKQVPWSVHTRVLHGTWSPGINRLCPHPFRICYNSSSPYRPTMLNKCTFNRSVNTTALRSHYKRRVQRSRRLGHFTCTLESRWDECRQVSMSRRLGGGRRYKARVEGRPRQSNESAQRETRLVKQRPRRARARLWKLLGATGVFTRPGKASYWRESARRPSQANDSRSNAVHSQSIQISTIQNILLGRFAARKTPRTTAAVASNATFKH